MWARPWVLAILALASVQLMVVIAPETVPLPLISRRELGGDQVFGAALACFSAGGLLGALAAIRWRPRRPGLVGLLGLLPFALVPLALLHPFAAWAVLAAYFAAGLGIEPFMVFWQVALQREIPRERLARVTSLDWMCSLALLPLGLALTGPAVNAFGEGPVLWVGVVVELVPTLFLLLVPGMVGFRTPPAGSCEPAVEVVSASVRG